MNRRRGSTVTVEVEIGDVLDELNDSDFVKEAEARGFAVLSKDDLEEMRSSLCRRDVAGALSALEASLPRRFRGLADDLQRALGNQSGMHA